MDLHLFPYCIIIHKDSSHLYQGDGSKEVLTPPVCMCVVSRVYVRIHLQLDIFQCYVYMRRSYRPVASSRHARTHARASIEFCKLNTSVRASMRYTIDRTYACPVLTGGSAAWFSLRAQLHTSVQDLHHIYVNCANRYRVYLSCGRSAPAFPLAAWIDMWALHCVDPSTFAWRGVVTRQV